MPPVNAAIVTLAATRFIQTAWSIYCLDLLYNVKARV
jgi:hypothetical protein